MKEIKKYFGLLTICIFSLLTIGCSKKEWQESNVPVKINNFYPNSGKGGTLVTISGEGFSTELGQTTVTFAGTSAEILTAKPNELVVRAPEGGESGMIRLNQGGTIVEVGAYAYQSLSVQAILPQRAQQGGQIRISGEGFGSLHNPPKVTINGHEANLISALDTLLVIEVPAGAGTGVVEVSVDGMNAAGPVFYFMAINSVKPLSGGKGTKVIIEGSGFETAATANAVSFNGKPANVVEASEQQLVVIVPDGVETGRILLTIGEEPIIGPDFTVVPPPSVALVTPLSGPAGTEMIIKGKTFSSILNENKVRINGVEVPLKSATTTEIRLTIPGNTGSGKVEVITNDQAVEGPDFRDQNVGISSISPDNGLEGTAITILGTGFSSTATSNMVTINGLQATVVSANATNLVVRAPNNVRSGVVKVVVDGVEALSSTSFRRAGVITLAGASDGLNIASAGGSIAVDDHENVYVLEVSNNRVVKITSTGQVSVLAGSGSQGAEDGQGISASFRTDVYSGLVYDSHTDMLFLSDAGNQSLRAISLQGRVSTVIGNFGGAIGKPVLRSNGAIYVPRSAINSMWVVSPLVGSVSTVSAGYTASASRAQRMAVDAAGNVYNIYNTSSSYVHRVSAYTLLSSGSFATTHGFAGGTLASYLDGIGTAARFNSIYGMAMLDTQNLVVIDANNYALRQVNTSTRETSTILKSGSGFEDGDFRDAKISNAVRDLVVSKDGKVIYLLDCGNNAVRKVLLQ